MSESLLWQITRTSNCNLRKQQGKVFFTKEKGNLTSMNSFKASGLANERTADISVGKDGNVVLSFKSNKAMLSKPAKMYKSITLNKGARRSLKIVDKVLSKTRPDLKKVALARASKLIKAQNKAKAASK